jgi:hypothetical protein
MLQLVVNDAGTIHKSSLCLHVFQVKYIAMPSSLCFALQYDSLMDLQYCQTNKHNVHFFSFHAILLSFQGAKIVDQIVNIVSVGMIDCIPILGIGVHIYAHR